MAFSSPKKSALLAMSSSSKQVDYIGTEKSH